MSSVSLSDNPDVDYAEYLVRTNMLAYYQRHALEWESARFRERWAELANYGILADGVRVGILSLSFEEGICYIRDLQVEVAAQNQGIGSAVLQLVGDLARERGAWKLRLRVFEDSPAIALYQRCGFEVVRKDGVFWGMEQGLHSKGGDERKTFLGKCCRG